MPEKKSILDISKIKVYFDFDIPIVPFFGVLLILAFIVSGGIYVSSPKDPISRFVDAATFFLLVAGGVFVALTAYCQWKTTSEQVKQTNYQICKDMNITAMTLMEAWNQENLEAERTHYRDLRLLRANKSDADMLALINKNHDYRDTICDIANYFELVSIAINAGVANEEILASGLKPLLQSVKKTYDPWFKDLFDNDPDYYNQFKPFFNLLERWR